MPDAIRSIQGALDRLFHPDRYNLMFLMNADPHVHLHVVPRYSTPRTYGGAVFTDPDFGAQSQSPARMMADSWLNRLASDLREVSAERPD